MTDVDELFPTSSEGLPDAQDVTVVRLHDGDELDLRIRPVRKRVGDDVLRMLAYNDSIPGPILHVDQGSRLTVEVQNEGDMEATVHWHGLRVENRYDGVPFETQPPIPVGGHYTQQIQFPDAGVYWYHPHIREDYGLELGLYGTVVVEPSDPSYLFSSRSPCQCTVVSRSPSLVTLTTISEPCWTFSVGPGIEPL